VSSQKTIFIVSVVTTKRSPNFTQCFVSVQIWGIFTEGRTKIDGVTKGTNARLQKTAYKSFVFGTVQEIFFRVI
jgi:hypothetical protein